MENNYKLSSSYYNVILSTKNYDLLEKLYDYGCPLTKKQFQLALHLYDLNLIIWLHDKKCEVCHSNMVYIVKHRQWDILQWCILNDYNIDTNLYIRAMNRGFEINSLD